MFTERQKLIESTEPAVKKPHINRSHLCQICGQSFKTASYVKIHMRIHTNERPFKCKHCDKRFRQSNDLKYHTTSFHGIKKYPCQLCDKKFVLPTNLKTHMRTHNGNLKENSKNNKKIIKFFFLFSR